MNELLAVKLAGSSERRGGKLFQERAAYNSLFDDMKKGTQFGKLVIEISRDASSKL